MSRTQLMGFAAHGVSIRSMIALIKIKDIDLS